MSASSWKTKSFINRKNKTQPYVDQEKKIELCRTCITQLATESQTSNMMNKYRIISF
ncbi:hypothetical protein OIU79_006994 [Salix purpurea]|uniref:Uncharacterized protein n=1 Tax=Salix purpurea TaxID=77065 RepID=A0A9Q0Z2U1_SALPP|nr:hypothetical protein OIU79_006994 [Salix purpurea]